MGGLVDVGGCELEIDRGSRGPSPFPSVGEGEYQSIVLDQSLVGMGDEYSQAHPSQ